ncbi:GATA transcription factor [Actinidia chinensis var. chinensis]|uniref:GATA transcription factor n=1 Tax=Actinidia chinensis var. chinensis TaxID=1590841 RepID=A0A2R6PAL6_ACTCC|nr:GATA transcription factor [Actinidia chinensis var. chinensis]
MIFSMFSHNGYDEADSYSSFPSSSVDCTLSLGTPSTRVSSAASERGKRVNPHDPRSSFCWDILSSQTTPNTNYRGSNHDNNNSGSGGDPVLLARRCANCDTTSTPLWRNGPRGPKSLCNACGIRFKKEERRATATAAASGAMDPRPHHHTIINNSSSWDVGHHSNSQTAPNCFSPVTANEYVFVDRPSLVHDYFTR